MRHLMPTGHTFTEKYGPCNRTITGVSTFCAVINKHYKSGDPLKEHKTVKWKDPTHIGRNQIGTDCQNVVECFTGKCKHLPRDVNSLLSESFVVGIFSFPDNIMIQE